jgi:hypothetical protein
MKPSSKYTNPQSYKGQASKYTHHVVHYNIMAFHWKFGIRTHTERLHINAATHFHLFIHNNLDIIESTPLHMIVDLRVEENMDIQSSHFSGSTAIGESGQKTS